jgi:Zn-dependent protease with chaperone function
MRRSTLGGGRAMGIGLLLLTLSLDYPILFLRAGAALFVGGPFLGEHVLWLAGVCAYLPQARSLFGLLIPPRTTVAARHRIGAREPSAREWERIEPALDVCARDRVKAPRNVWVVDTAEEVAFVSGRSLFLQRDTIWSPHLAGWIAHELGHLNSIDLRLKQAVRWASVPLLTSFGNRVIGKGGVVFWPIAVVRIVVGVYIKALAGGFIPRIVTPAWNFYWRRREYIADDFAMSIGQGESLAAGLEETLAFDSSTPWMKDRSHPYVELRIDRLRSLRGKEPPAEHTYRATPTVVVD